MGYNDHLRDAEEQTTAVWSEETYDYDSDSQKECRDLNDDMDRDVGQEYWNYVDE